MNLNKEWIEKSTLLKNLLGIPELDFYLDLPQLLPYQIKIVDYLNTKLLILPENDIKQRILEILRIFREGAELICNDGAQDLAFLVGTPYDDRFVFSWSNGLSTLCLRLKFQYADLWNEDPNWECCQCNPKGYTTEDYENWSSGINVTKTEKHDCGCSYREK